MRSLLAIKVQSMTDLITNSSSELFQLRTDYTVEQVSKALKTVTSGYCEPVLFSVDRYREIKGKFLELLRKIEPEYGDYSDDSWDKYWEQCDQIKRENSEYFVMHTVSGWFFDPENPEDVYSVYKDYLCNEYDQYKPDSLQTEFRKFVEENNYFIEKRPYYAFSLYNIK